MIVAQPPELLSSESTHAAGAVYILLSGLCQSLLSILVKLLAHRRVPASETITSRFYFHTVAVVAYFVFARRGKLFAPSTWLGRPENCGLLFARALLGFGTVVFYIVALVQPGAQPADVAALLHLAVPASAAMAWLLLGESLRLREVAAMLLCIVGAFLVAQPAFAFAADNVALTGGDRQSVPLLVVTAASLSLLCTAASSLIMRRIGDKEDTAVVLLWVSCVGAVLSLLMPLMASRELDDVDTDHARAVKSLLFAGVCIVSLALQVALNRGWQLIKSSSGFALRLVDVPASALLQALLFSEVANSLKVIGCSLIVASIAYLIALKPPFVTPKRRDVSSAIAPAMVQ